MFSRVHRSHARRAGSRTSNTRWPPGRSAARTPRSVADQSSSVRNTWATLAVIVARSTWSSGSPVASPCRQRTRSAPGLARATSSEAAAGSTPVTSRPWPAARHAKVPVPQPTSSRLCAPARPLSPGSDRDRRVPPRPGHKSPPAEAHQRGHPPPSQPRKRPPPPATRAAAPRPADRPPCRRLSLNRPAPLPQPPDHPLFPESHATHITGPRARGRPSMTLTVFGS